jgi:hypothetical protein
MSDPKSLGSCCGRKFSPFIVGFILIFGSIAIRVLLKLGLDLLVQGTSIWHFGWFVSDFFRLLGILGVGLLVYACIYGFICRFRKDG